MVDSTPPLQTWQISESQRCRRYLSMFVINAWFPVSHKGSSDMESGEERRPRDPVNYLIVTQIPINPLQKSHSKELISTPNRYNSEPYTSHGSAIAKYMNGGLNTSLTNLANIRVTKMSAISLHICHQCLVSCQP